MTAATTSFLVLRSGRATCTFPAALGLAGLQAISATWDPQRLASAVPKPPQNEQFR